MTRMTALGNPGTGNDKDSKVHKPLDHQNRFADGRREAGLLELGVCYYPEQWPREKWEEDARRMAELGLA